MQCKLEVLDQFDIETTHYCTNGKLRIQRDSFSVSALKCVHISGQKFKVLTAELSQKADHWSVNCAAQ